MFPFPCSKHCSGVYWWKQKGMGKVWCVFKDLPSRREVDLPSKREADQRITERVACWQQRMAQDGGQGLGQDPESQPSTVVARMLGEAPHACVREDLWVLGKNKASLIWETLYNLKSFIKAEYLCFSHVAQLVKNLPAMRETWIQFLGWEDPLEKGTATYPSILVWRIPWTVYSPWGCKESDTIDQLSLTFT